MKSKYDSKDNLFRSKGRVKLKPRRSSMIHIKAMKEIDKRVRASNFEKGEELVENGYNQADALDTYLLGPNKAQEPFEHKQSSNDMFLQTLNSNLLESITAGLHASEDEKFLTEIFQSYTEEKSERQFETVSQEAMENTFIQKIESNAIDGQEELECSKFTNFRKKMLNDAMLDLNENKYCFLNDLEKEIDFVSRVPFGNRTGLMKTVTSLGNGGKRNSAPALNSEKEKPLRIHSMNSYQK